MDSTTVSESFEGHELLINYLHTNVTRKAIGDNYIMTSQSTNNLSGISWPTQVHNFTCASQAHDGDDAESNLAAWDSTLPFLAPIGAGEMWGDQPFSQRAGQRQEVIDIINGTTKIRWWSPILDC